MANTKKDRPSKEMFTDESAEEPAPINSDSNEISAEENRETLIKEISEIEEALNNHEFLGLLSDPEFHKKLERICESLYAKFSPPAYSAEDLKQDVLRTVLQVEQIHKTSNITTWIYRIALNQLIDVFRRTQERPHLESLSFKDSRSITYFLESESRTLLEEVLVELSDTERKLVTDFFILGKSVTELAAEQKLSRQAVTKRLQRIIEKLRAYTSEPTETTLEIVHGIAKAFRASGEHDRTTDSTLTSPIEKPEDKLRKMLLDSGLLTEIPPTAANFTSSRKRKPIKVKGKPLSETIIEERR